MTWPNCPDIHKGKYWSEHWPIVGKWTKMKRPEVYRKPFNVVRTFPDRLDMPLRWRKPRAVAVGFGGDLFHEDVSDAFILDALYIMASSTEHRFIILTKRVARANAMFQRFVTLKHMPPKLYPANYTTAAARRLELIHRIRTATPELLNKLLQIARESRQSREDDTPRTLEQLLHHIYIGASVSDQDTLDDALRHLTELYNAGWRTMLSLEPLLGPVVLPVPLPCNWVVVGAESGKGRRECRDLWIGGITGICKLTGVPVFVKQIHRDGRVAHNIRDWYRELPE